MTEVEAYIERVRQQKQQREIEITVSRAEILSELRKSGIEQIDADYSGYNDSGDIDAISASGGDLNSKVKQAVSDIFWHYLIFVHSGFEINEGSQGQITWLIADDSIAIHHEQNYLSVEYTEDEF